MSKTISTALASSSTVQAPSSTDDDDADHEAADTMHGAFSVQELALDDCTFSLTEQQKRFIKYYFDLLVVDGSGEFDPIDLAGFMLYGFGLNTFATRSS